MIHLIEKTALLECVILPVYYNTETCTQYIGQGREGAGMVSSFNLIIISTQS